MSNRADRSLPGRSWNREAVPSLAGTVDDGAVKLLIRCAEIHQQFKHFIDHFVQARASGLSILLITTMTRWLSCRGAFEQQTASAAWALQMRPKQQHAVYHF